MTLPAHHRPLLASLAVLAALYALAAFRYADAGFFSLHVFLNLLRDNAVLGIVAVGMTFVILSGGIDLSVGAVASASSVLVGVLIMNAGMPAPLALAAAVALGTAYGAGMGAIIHASGLKPFIATLAGMFLVRGLGYVLRLEPIAIDDPGHARLAAIALPIFGLGDLAVTAIVFLGVVAAGSGVAARTPFGRRVYAVGGSEDAARLMGLPVARTKVGVYAISGFCAALAGGVLTLDLSSGSHIEGIGLELDAIAAVVIGGTLLSGGVGGVPGTLVGVLVVGILRTAVTDYEGLSSGLTKAAIGAALLLLVLVQRVLSRRGANPAATPAARA